MKKKMTLFCSNLVNMGLKIQYLTYSPNGEKLQVNKFK